MFKNTILGMSTDLRISFIYLLHKTAVFNLTADTLSGVPVFERVTTH